VIQKKLTTRIGLIGILFVLQLSIAQGQNKLTQYVQPMIGTAGTGHTFPGATLPFGMVQLSPDTRADGSWEGCSGYYHNDKKILGFSHTHLSGTGCSDYGDVLLMPINKFIQPKKGNYQSSFSHNTEEAKAGFYKVKLASHNIDAALTATLRTGIHQYTYAPKDSQYVIIDLTHRDEVLDSEFEIIYPNRIAGYRQSKAWATDQKIFFNMEFSKPIKEIYFFSNDSINQRPYQRGKNLKALILFDNRENKLVVKCGISGTSIANAALNLKTETGDKFDFDYFKQKADTEWENTLKSITIKDGGKSDKIKFYTALYHCFIAPNIYSDVNGQYMGRDKKVHQLAAGRNYYTVFSLWDTYRALHPLLTNLFKDKTNDFIQTFLLQYEQGGRLPIWELSSNETNCMIGYHAIPVIWDAYSKGVNNYDAQYALTAMMSIANENSDALNSYKKYGFVRSDDEAESVSKTIEYAYDDWCIAQMAKAILENKSTIQANNNFSNSKTDYSLSALDSIYEEFSIRSNYWKNVYDPTTGFMRARLNGTLYQPFSPYRVDNNFTEANSWQYSFYAPHQIDELIAVRGGKVKFEKYLDSLFAANTATEGRQQADITGLIGQYAHGNEPSHHIAFLYNYIDNNAATDKITNQIKNELYGTNEEGLCGNEDCGQMSVWYVWASLGLYPTCPGAGWYATCTPTFQNVEFLNIEDKQAKPKSLDEFFNIKRIDNKVIYKKSSIDKALPFMPNPFIKQGERFFKDSMLIEMDCAHKDAKIFYSIDNQERLYVAPFYIYKNTKINFYSAWDRAKSCVMESEFKILPNDRIAQLNIAPNKSYTSGGAQCLIDGIHGTTNWRTGNWQGYQESNFDAAVIFNKSKQLKNIEVSFLQDQGSWIFYPTKVIIEASTDGNKFTPLYEQAIEVPRSNGPNSIMNIQVPKNIMSALGKIKTIRVRAINYGKLPEWHPGAGGDAFIFVDEISID
jgi:predicted alpha-1,2-mannosidase